MLLLGYNCIICMSKVKIIGFWMISYYIYLFFEIKFNIYIIFTPIRPILGLDYLIILSKF